MNCNSIAPVSLVAPTNAAVFGMIDELQAARGENRCFALHDLKEESGQVELLVEIHSCMQEART